MDRFKTLSVFFVVLLVILAFLGFQYYSLQQQYFSLFSEFSSFKKTCASRISEKNQQISSLQQRNQLLQSRLSSLNSSYSDLSEEFLYLNQSHQSLQRDYGGLKTQVEWTVDKLNTYESDIQESIEWFRSNSLLGDSQREDYARSYLDRDCVYVDDDCHLKTGCLYLVNEENLDLHYKYDILVSDSLDKLQSLDDFMSNHGGDCEDYALFYKAEWNFLLDQCSSPMVEEIVVHSWFKDGDSSDRHWLDFDRDWFLEPVTEIDLPSGFVFPNVVCGTLYDFNKDRLGGHCVIAFTDRRISSISDLDLLHSAPLVEPQDGRFLGLIDDPSSETFLLSDGDTFDTHEAFISTVITDEDYFLYSQKEMSWQSYTVFLEELGEYREELQS